jgi:hypothetical protein
MIPTPPDSDFNWIFILIAIIFVLLVIRKGFLML